MPLDVAYVKRKLSPAQIRSIAHSQGRINAWTGAIRSGKTVASLLRWLIYIAVDAPARGRLVMVGKTKDTIARNVFAVLQDPDIFGPLADEVRYTPGANTATILGRTVDVIGANNALSEGRLRGLTCAGSYVDEATLITEDFFVQLLGRMSVPGAKLFLTTNPDNPAHWLRRDYLLRIADPNLGLRHWHFTLDDNPSIGEDLKAFYKASFVGLFYKRFIQGLWVAAEGAIFDMFDDRVHVVDDDKLPLIRRWLSCGVDYGTTNPFAAIALGIGVDQRLYAVSEYRYDGRIRRRSKTDAEYSTDMRAWLANVRIPQPRAAEPVRRKPAAGGQELRGIRPEWVCVDPSAASYIQQLYRDGLTPASARNEVLDGIRNLAMLFGTRRLFVAASCTGLLDEIPGYSWDDKEALKGIDAPVKVDDHSIDALRYAVHTTEGVWRPLLHLPEVMSR